MNLEVVHRVRAQAHLPEDGSDVVLEETIVAPRHLERAAENGEGSSKLAVVVGVAQFKLHVSARADSLLETRGRLNVEFVSWSLHTGFALTRNFRYFTG